MRQPLEWKHTKTNRDIQAHKITKNNIGLLSRWSVKGNAGKETYQENEKLNVFSSADEHNFKCD